MFNSIEKSYFDFEYTWNWFGLIQVQTEYHLSENECLANYLINIAGNELENFHLKFSNPFKFDIDTDINYQELEQSTL